MDKLKQYLSHANITAAAFSRKIGTSRGYVHDMLTGRRVPGRQVATSIERETGGLVPVSCWEPARDAA